jgi:hypothetical protein
LLKVTHGSKEQSFYSLSEAAQIITHNLWGIPVAGIHSETLRRAYRDSGRRHGTAIGRDIFFAVSDLQAMGYKALGRNIVGTGNLVTLVMED